MKESLLIAIGGNSLIRAGQKGTIPEQLANARSLAANIAEIAVRGFRFVLTHGNGPQVGSQLLRSELASAQTYPLSLDVCVSMSQGEIGYILQNALQSALSSRGLRIPVATLLTQVVVERTDPAFLNPMKPIGPFYSKEAALRKEEDLGWTMIEDAARGYRRVVPSPRPLRILELDVIAKCLELGMILIAAGGGGIPVTDENGTFIGVEAVIDKDSVSALLAVELRVEHFLISTDVDYVYVNYKRPGEKAITSMSVEEAKRYMQEGHFLEGSMKPKIDAAIQFLEAGGRDVIITSNENLLTALEGKTGTRIVK